jgi:hypothetical protein
MYVCPAKEGFTTAGSEGSPRLQAEELGIARLLEGPNDDRAGLIPTAPHLFGLSMTDGDVALVQARRTLQFIEAARECFPAMRELADHPGWEMVLHLFIAGREDRQINTVDICTLTGTWRPLAVRYIEMLFERGLVEREVSDGKPDDWTLSLSLAAQARLQELLCGFARTAAAHEERGATN